tara:strand:- start:119334 stop:119924 length:591 start_codon:yes stop_codon:yes gene_type:complete
MKNFKYITLAFIAVVGLTTLTSCEDEDKSPIPPLGNGGFVKFVELPEFNAGADPTSASFNAMTEDPNGNLASYELRVVGDFTDAPEDTLAFRSTTTFPFDVSFTASDMAALFGVDVTTFETGDSFEFLGSATTVDGLVYDYTTPGCDCPTPEDGELVVEDPGTYNGGTTDAVLINAAGLLQAFNYEVEFNDPPVED